MADKIKIIPYSPAHKQAIIELLDSKPFKQEIWDWQFLDNPCAGKFDPVILADRWGTVIGFNGTMPIRIKLDDHIVKGLWSCDFFVDERYHGMGYGRFIKEALHTRSQLIMALGISGMAAPVLLRMGWKNNNIVDSYRKLNRISKTKSILITLVQYLNHMGAAHKRPLSGHWETDISMKLPDAAALDPLWVSVSSGYGKIVVRDYAYLHWRYENHPLAVYTFIRAQGASGLAALLVVRITRTSGHLIDYVGPALDYGVKAALLNRFLALTAGLEYLTCITSDKEWKQLLLDSGFYKQQGNPRFYIHTQTIPDADSFSDWFIMAGDSDGDMLKASEEGPFRYPRINQTVHLEVRQLSEATFLEMEDEWNRLLGVSDADPLFMGWIWQSLWWRQWAAKRGYELYLLGVYTSDNTLAGLAPLYKIRKKLLPLYHYTQLQFIGSSWSNGETVRSEYLDFIVNRHYADEVRQVFLDYLEVDYSWDQLIFSDLDTRSHTRKKLAQKSVFSNCYTRTVQSDTGITIDASKDIGEYLAGMGRNTRYSAFNQRKYLQGMGTVRIEYAHTGVSDSFLDSLNKLHALRWGKPCFPRESLDFHKGLARVYSETGNLKLSMLYSSDEPISVLYNIRLGMREYNIQVGFNSSFDRKLSPGFLHLGYAIESVFDSAETLELDLLAGAGKNTFYKSHFGSKKTGFITLQVNRSRYLQSIYKMYDFLPHNVKAMVKKSLLNRESD